MEFLRCAPVATTAVEEVRSSFEKPHFLRITWICSQLIAPPWCFICFSEKAVVASKVTVNDGKKQQLLLLRLNGELPWCCGFIFRKIHVAL
jgi:hypothetical protein